MPTCKVLWNKQEGNAYFNVKIGGVLYTYSCFEDHFMLIRSEYLTGNISSLETVDWTPYSQIAGENVDV